MTDAALERRLTGAFLTPASPERPDLTAAVMRRVRAADRRRRAVILASGAGGTALASAAIAATLAADPATFEGVARLAVTPAAAVAIGLALTLLAAARHALREI